MQEIGIIQVLLLSVWAFLSINEMLGPYLGLWHRPLIAGVGAGIILGDINTGLFIGATLEMMSLGVQVNSEWATQEQAFRLSKDELS